MTIRLLIADDHAIVREGLKQLLSLYEDVCVIDEATDGEHLLTQLQQHQPDIVTLDMQMPGLSGIPLIETLTEKYPALPVLVLSMYNETQITRRALKAGARGYLNKDCDADTLLTAIRRLARGGRFIESEMAEKLAFEFEEPAEEPRHHSLSKREFHIFCLLARGMSINDIAQDLNISNKTVSTHKFRLMQKMNFSSNTDIVRYALTHHLIQ